MKRTLIALVGIAAVALVASCGGKATNSTAVQEQARTEENQANLNRVQPAPHISWSLERDNLIRRDKLMNDRAISFYMYVFIEGCPDPIGYYQINKVSSVDSQLTNTMQLASQYQIPSSTRDITGTFSSHLVDGTLPSPAEDGSYGTNGTGVFGFTPEGVYLEHNMHYIVSTIPLQFAKPCIRLAVINSPEARTLVNRSNEVMGKEGIN